MRAIVIGAGQFGRNHARVIRELEGVELAGICDTNPERAAAVAAEYGSKPYADFTDVPGKIDAAIVAAPTTAHEELTARLLEAGIDVLVEKPMAPTSAAAERIARLASERGRVLQIGHLERFNPAVRAVERALTVPLFFEVHRLSVFTPRSLDVDVVFDLMIHDLDLVLHFTGEEPDEVRAAGISVLSPKVDIANVRLAFASGCIANLTASRVSTEQVRKLRVFQPGEYLSIDYKRQDVVRLSVQGAENGAKPQIGFSEIAVEKAEPLKKELESFFEAVRTRRVPEVDGAQGTAALRVAEQIIDKIKEHSRVVSQTLQHRSR